MEKFDRIKYNNEFNARTYDNVRVLVRRDSELNLQAIKAHVEKTGESINAFVNRAIAEQIKRDNAHE